MTQLEELLEEIRELERKVDILEKRLAWYQENSHQVTLGFEG